MSKKNRQYPVHQPLPPDFKKRLLSEWHRTFTWKERLQILIGYRARLTMEMVTEHSPGKYDVSLNLVTTKELEPRKVGA